MSNTESVVSFSDGSRKRNKNERLAAIERANCTKRKPYVPTTAIMATLMKYYGNRDKLPNPDILRTIKISTLGTYEEEFLRATLLTEFSSLDEKQTAIYRLMLTNLRTVLSLNS